MPNLEVFHYPVPLNTEPSRRIRVLIWNVWYRADPRQLFSELAALDCDVMLLMELTLCSKKHPSTNLPNRIVRNLGYGGVFVECRRFGGRSGQANREGSAIFSRLPLWPGPIVPLSRGGRAPGKGGPDNLRCYLEVEVSGWVFGLAHLSYKTPFNGAHKNQEIDRLTGAIGKNSQRFVLGVDANDEPQSLAVGVLGNRLKHLGPGMDQPSWRRGPFKRRLDYVFGTSDVRAQGVFGQTAASDHLPLILELEA